MPAIIGAMIRKGCSILVVLLVIGGFIAALPFALRAYTALRFHGDIYAAETVPQREVAIIFGARVMPSGRPSAMLYDRIATGADLFHRGKVEYLLMSGDSRAPEYDETAVMKAHAIRLGVPPEAILIDPAGLRTFESCRRAQDEFDLHNVILVTQDFHLDRALMLCRGLGLDAVGVAADYQRPWGYAERSLRWSQWREIPATSVALLDLAKAKIGLK